MTQGVSIKSERRLPYRSMLEIYSGDVLRFAALQRCDLRGGLLDEANGLNQVARRRDHGDRNRKILCGAGRMCAPAGGAHRADR